MISINDDNNEMNENMLMITIIIMTRKYDKS